MEALLLLLGTNLETADILAQPPTLPPDAPLGEPIAHDITARTLYTTHTVCRGASLVTDAETLADAERMRAFERAANKFATSETCIP